MKWGVLGVLALGVVAAGCQEKLTAPADCPALCPGGLPVVYDEVFSPIAGADSSFGGYVQRHAAAALLVSNRLQGSEDLALVRYNRRSDSVSVRDTLRAYTIDSVALSFNLVARDTNLTDLRVLLYRIPLTFDSTTTYAGVAPAFVAANLVATIAVPDTLNAGAIRTVLSGPDLSKVALAPADSGRLALGVGIAAATPTGLRLGSLASGTGPVFTTHVTADIPDTSTAAKLRTLTVGPAFNTYVSEVPPPVDTTLLAVGGDPSARALLRFDLPPRIRDSATIVRATLELTPVTPITGLPTDPGRMLARALLTDVGAKSPVNTTPARVSVDTLADGLTPVGLEVVRLVELWLGAAAGPSALSLSFPLDLEAASFTRPVFHSTRAADPAVRPRLRLSYLLKFPFESP